jgi:AcrR family transcriptional regulator/DNA-binding MarR family transcriptional regulator
MPTKQIQAQPEAGEGAARARVGEIQRARILAAMTEVCAERGAANVTVARVVKRSGVSRRTFYELFDDCRDCVNAAIDQALARLTERVLPAYRENGSWRERIEGALVALLSFLEDDPDMGGLLVIEALGGTPMLERRDRVLAEVVRAVEQGRGEKALKKSPPPLTAEGVVGGVLSVLRARLLDRAPGSLLELKGQLMCMIVLPYLGQAAAQRELARPAPPLRSKALSAPTNPLRDLEMRLTYRTVRVLSSVAARPNASNREIGFAAGIQDQGQISKLLTRLHRLGLIEKTNGETRGAPNAWTLTAKGHEIQRALGERAVPDGRSRACA